MNMFTMHDTASAMVSACRRARAMWTFWRKNLSCALNRNFDSLDDGSERDSVRLHRCT